MYSNDPIRTPPVILTTVLLYNTQETCPTDLSTLYLWYIIHYWYTRPRTKKYKNPAPGPAARRGSLFFFLHTAALYHTSIISYKPIHLRCLLHGLRKEELSNCSRVPAYNTKCMVLVCNTYSYSITDWARSNGPPSDRQPLATVPMTDDIACSVAAVGPVSRRSEIWGLVAATCILSAASSTV